MGHTVKMHHNDDNHGTRNTWRPTHQAKKSMLAVDGMPAVWDEGVVMTCPSCGCAFGVGMDSDGSTPRIKDGVTVDVVKCMNPLGCAWVSDGPVTFDKHQDAEGRERYNKMTATYEDEVHQARIRTIHEKVANDLRNEADARALEQVNAFIGNSKGPDAAKKLNDFLKNGGKLK